jgi:hypothetical protein
MHTLCERYLLLCRQTSVHIMCSRDVLRYYWFSGVHSLSYRNNIISWRIIMHPNTNKLSERIVLLHSRICVHIMLGGNIY